MRTLTFILGTVLCVYGCAGTVFETFYADSAEAERVLCRCLLCHDARVVWSARQQLTGPKKEDLEGATGAFRTVLQRDPQDPHRWADLGEAFLEGGQREEARYCYRRVLALAPRVPPFLIRAANFDFLIGENREALGITARILGMIPDYDAVIFSEYTRLADSRAVLEYGLPEDRRGARAWLRYLMQAGRLSDAEGTWEWAAPRGFADDALAGEYAEFLIGQGRAREAAAAWVRHLGARAAI